MLHIRPIVLTLLAMVAWALVLLQKQRQAGP